MTLLSITKWTLFSFWYFKSISLNRLSCSSLWSTHMKPAHLTWSGTYTVVWKKMKGWFSYVLIWSTCFWGRFSWENTVMSALEVWHWYKWPQHAGTSVMLLLTPPVPLIPAVPELVRSLLLQDSPQKGGVPSMWELRCFPFNRTQNGLWGRESNTKLFPLQTRFINTFNIKTASVAGDIAQQAEHLPRVQFPVHKTRRGARSL